MKASDAAFEVLSHSDGPLHVKDVADQMVSQGLSARSKPRMSGPDYAAGWPSLLASLPSRALARPAERRARGPYSSGTGRRSGPRSSSAFGAHRTLLPGSRSRSCDRWLSAELTIVTPRTKKSGATRLEAFVSGPRDRFLTTYQVVTGPAESGSPQGIDFAATPPCSVGHYRSDAYRWSRRARRADVIFVHRLLKGTRFLGGAESQAGALDPEGLDA
jgi:hypothetical protein